jgi:hypothetical protein
MRAWIEKQIAGIITVSAILLVIVIGILAITIISIKERICGTEN